MAEVDANKPYIRKYSHKLLKDLRKIDLDTISRIEVYGVCGLVNLHSNLVQCLSASSQAYLLYDPQGNPHGALGIVNHKGVGVPWFLHSGEVTERYPLGFYKGSLKLVKSWMKLYPEMFNYVWTGHEEAHRWLERLGFTVDKSHEHTFVIPTIQFYKFYYKRD